MTPPCLRRRQIPRHERHRTAVLPSCASAAGIQDRCSTRSWTPPLALLKLRLADVFRPAPPAVVRTAGSGDACFAPVLDWDEAPPARPQPRARHVHRGRWRAPARASAFRRGVPEHCPARAASLQDTLAAWNTRSEETPYPCLTQAIHQEPAARAGATAAICGEEQADWSQLAQRIGRWHRPAGAGRGARRRVGMMGLNSIRYLEYFYGCWWAGAAVNPVSIRWSAQEVACSLDDCDTRVLFVDDAFAPWCPGCASCPPACTPWCSRHGRRARGALHYEQLLAAALLRRRCAAAQRPGRRDVYGRHHGPAQGGDAQPDNLFINALSMPATCRASVIVPAFDELAILAGIQQHGVNELFLVPTMIRRLIEHPRLAEFDLSSLRLMLYGAAPIDATLLERTMQLLPGADFAQAYGATDVAHHRVHGPGRAPSRPQRERLLRAQPASP
ncbi:Bile acyl-CoA synthetase [Manis javanica]|nr:Bile acyl-CoA synthetase [Manis javanica]